MTNMILSKVARNVLITLSASFALLSLSEIATAQSAISTAAAPATSAPQCTPAPTCQCNCPAVPSIAATGPAPATLDNYKGRLERTNYSALPEFERDNMTETVAAFKLGCEVLVSQQPWQAVCNKARALPSKLTVSQARNFFVENFDPWTVINADESRDGMMTGYYEPLLNGSRTKTDRYRYPIYAEPQDLITVDIGEAVPDVKHKRLRGRMLGNKVIPYYNREEIEGPGNPLRGLEIAYVDDAVELFFLQIQGSGQIRLPDGSAMRVGYANQNGHPFRSTAGALIRAREIRIEQSSMQGIKAWAAANPAKVQSFLNLNPSYVFFKELRGDLSGPIGTLGVPLTSERSIAVDPRVIPLGPPVFISTTMPASKTPLNRLVVAQDTGGAILGGIRADFYWGFGDAAGNLAGRTKQSLRLWTLLPRGYTPEQFLPLQAK
jgi:membrane-bound lytic murein transglycosylase A